MSQRHDEFWAGFFGIAAADLGEAGVSVGSHVGLDGYRGVWFFLRGRRLVVSAPRPWVPHIRGLLAPTPNPTLPDQKALHEIFGSSLERSIGPAFQGALEAAQLRTTTSRHVRALTEADSDAVSAFRDLCGVEDWEDSAIEKAQLLRCGYFDKGRVVSIAGFRHWSSAAGDPCVLTLPAYRGRGHAKEVVGSVLAAAIAQGHLLLYQTLEANVAAVHVALGLGYVRYANHIAVRLATEEPPNEALQRTGPSATLSVPPLNALCVGQTGVEDAMRKIEIVGVHPVDAPEPCHLIEMIASDTDIESLMGEITQEVPGEQRDNWQAAYDEHYLDASGSAVLDPEYAGQAPAGREARVAFFFHYLDVERPLLTPAGPVALPRPTTRPDRLAFMAYEEH